MGICWEGINEPNLARLHRQWAESSGNTGNIHLIILAWRTGATLTNIPDGEILPTAESQNPILQRIFSNTKHYGNKNHWGRHPPPVEPSIRSALKSGVIKSPARVNLFDTARVEKLTAVFVPSFPMSSTDHLPFCKHGKNVQRHHNSR